MKEKGGRSRKNSRLHWLKVPYSLLTRITNKIPVNIVHYRPNEFMNTLRVS